MKRYIAALLLAFGLCLPGLAHAQWPGAQGPVMFSSNCAASPQMGFAVVCFDTTLNAFSYWNGTNFVPNKVGQYPTSTVAGLATCNSAAAGTIAVVTDSTTVASEGQACAGTSSNKAVAICNGAAWHCF